MCLLRADEKAGNSVESKQMASLLALSLVVMRSKVAKWDSLKEL